ncbi:MAG: hypothetical protein V6010_00110 [Candidatus Dasytiphilus stammeri]
MKIISAPREPFVYAKFAHNAVMEVRMKLGMSRITLNYLPIANYLAPALIIDFYNSKNKLYTVRYNLPTDTIDRTERRVSLLLYLIRKKLNHPEKPVAA